VLMISSIYASLGIGLGIYFFNTHGYKSSISESAGRDRRVGWVVGR
jgi:hypothetical protein